MSWSTRPMNTSDRAILDASVDAIREVAADYGAPAWLVEGMNDLAEWLRENGPQVLDEMRGDAHCGLGAYCDHDVDHDHDPLPDGGFWRYGLGSRWRPGGGGS